MARITDLRDEETIGGTILADTSGGLFGSQYLADDPPATYLCEYELPQFVLRNKEGVTIAREGREESVPAGDGFQALAVVTDVRVLFLVGTESGDERRSLPLADLVEAKAGSAGILSGELRLVTTDTEVWRFPVRGNPATVAAYVDDAAQTWANASRLVDEAGERIEQSEEYLDDRAFEGARETLDGVTANLDRAETRIESVGEGARADLSRRADRLRDRLDRLRREIAAMKGADHHANAHTAWKEKHDFETAARQYDAAIREYERARGLDGETPTDGQLAARIEGARKEREILRFAPMSDAEAARELAVRADDPERAAPEWEEALACYREAVTLEWGTAKWGFQVQRDLARERAIEAAEETIDAHARAGEEWLLAADRIVARGRRTEARQAYERARNHFRDAREVAAELQPERVEELADRLESVEDRLTGKIVPGTALEQETLSVEAVADLLAETPEGGDFQAQDLGKQPAHTPGTTSQGTASDRAGGSSAPEATPDSRVPTPAPDAEAGDDDQKPDATPTTGQSSTGADSVGESEPTPAIRPVPDRSVPAGERTGTVDARDGAAGEQSDPLSALREMDESVLRALVADLLAAEGWSTTEFSATASTVYDIVAIRGDERQLVWTVNRPDGGAIGTTVVRRCATARDRSERTDRATLVTTGSLTSAAARRAEELGVRVLDGDDLVDRARAAGVLDGHV